MARETANCSVTPPCITSKSVSPLGFWILKLVHYPSRSESNACHLVADYFFSSEILIHLGTRIQYSERHGKKIGDVFKIALNRARPGLHESTGVRFYITEQF